MTTPRGIDTSLFWVYMYKVVGTIYVRKPDNYMISSGISDSKRSRQSGKLGCITVYWSILLFPNVHKVNIANKYLHVRHANIDTRPGIISSQWKTSLNILHSVIYPVNFKSQFHRKPPAPRIKICMKICVSIHINGYILLEMITYVL